MTSDYDATTRVAKCRSQWKLNSLSVTVLASEPLSLTCGVTVRRSITRFLRSLRSRRYTNTRVVSRKVNADHCRVAARRSFTRVRKHESCLRLNRVNAEEATERRANPRAAIPSKETRQTVQDKEDTKESTSGQESHSHLHLRAHNAIVSAPPVDAS
jgi:hypothetical protein